MTQVNEIFNYIQGINARTSTVSSIGTFTSSTNKQVADNLLSEVIEALPVGTLAHNIATTANNFTTKQLWVIAFQLEKNAEFCKMIAERNSNIEAQEAARKAKKAAKSAAKKEVAAKIEANAQRNFDGIQTVFHKIWGVVELVAQDENTITVIFNGEEKRLMKKYAPITF